MSLWNQITSLVKDPPPAYVFELSEAGIAYARDGQTGFEAFPEGTLRVSPLEDNLLRSDVAASLIGRIAPANGSRKRRPSTLILPDYAARVSVLDFDSFPSSEEEQAQLVRFRVKKTVPYDIDSAAVSFFAQPGSSLKGVGSKGAGSKGAGSKRVEVVAVMVSLEILARYEALFRHANFQPGEVTTSTLSALNLHRESGIAVVAKLAGKILTVAVAAQGRLKLFRCLALEEATDEEILAVLHPTFAYVEDELGQQVSKLVVCGFPQIPVGLRVPVEPLHSTLGVPGAFNAGLLGYLEGVRN